MFFYASLNMSDVRIHSDVFNDLSLWTRVPNNWTNRAWTQSNDLPRMGSMFTFAAFGKYLKAF